MRVLLILLALSATAHAEDLEAWLIGPVVGVRLGHGPGSALVLGVEGGYGIGPERINLGFEHRSDKMFYYAELDPWYIVGGSFGIGVEEDGKVRPVLGAWEGIPLTMNTPCTGWHEQATISGGYRYTGVHELYLTIKGGMMNGSFCWGG